jgi:medium-chain acyl-[acyl-carrier-protein] hydrolase
VEDGKVSRDRLESWREQTCASFALHLLPGDHFFLHTAQPMLFAILNHALRQVVSELRTSFTV